MVDVEVERVRRTLQAARTLSVAVVAAAAEVEDPNRTVKRLDQVRKSIAAEAHRNPLIVVVVEEVHQDKVIRLRTNRYHSWRVELPVLQKEAFSIDSDSAHISDTARWLSVGSCHSR